MCALYIGCLAAVEATENSVGWPMQILCSATQPSELRNAHLYDLALIIEDLNIPAVGQSPHWCLP